MYYDPNYYDWNTPTGWRCPICGKIWAPHVSFCYYCNAERKTFATTETIKVTPFDDAGWWNNFVKNTSADGQINIDSNNTITYTWPSSNVKCEEDESSWRDWLDEMRANYWKQEHLKEEND